MSTGTDITRRLRGEFDPGQMELIRSTVASDCNDAELAMFLEVCARHQLDPFTKQVWAIKIQGRVQIFASHDGFIAKAHESEMWSGLRSDVVRENDEFSKAPDGSIIHAYDGIPAKRGKIVGAWAECYRKDFEVPTFFYADWATYNQNRNVWKSHPDAMIVKCAETMALRKAFPISGIQSEVEAPRLPGETVTDTGPAYGGDALGAHLEGLFAALKYTHKKAKLRLAGLDDEGRENLARMLEDELRELGREVPERPVDAVAEEIPSEGDAEPEPVA